MVVLPSPIRGFHFDEPEQYLLAGGAAKRLLVACALGSVIGIRREYVRKATHREHLHIAENLRANAAVDQLLTFHDLEDE